MSLGFSHFRFPSALETSRWFQDGPREPHEESNVAHMAPRSPKSAARVPQETSFRPPSKGRN
eukprot:7433422-Pyramimonas_sp.AAC.1